MLAHLISISTLVVVASTTCFDNGDKEIQGLCYKFVAQKLSYNDAVNWCHYQNPVTASFLAYVPNQFASNFLASYARTSFGQNDGNFWIGLSRATTSSPWKWDSGDSLQFTNFDSSQLGQNYAAESIVKSNWGTFSSDQKMNFVCSYNPSAPPTFVPNTAVPSTPTPTAGIPTTTTQNVPTTTEFDYDDFCNVGEKHSTFLLAYAIDFDPDLYHNLVNNYIVPAIARDRHNYTKLARVRFDGKAVEPIEYLDDVVTFQTELSNLPPRISAAADPSTPSNVLSVITSFLNATGRPLESSMIILLVNRFPQIGLDISQAEYDKITNGNVKIFPIISNASFDREFQVSTRSFKALSNLAANSNGHFVIGALQQLQTPMGIIMNTAYTNSLAFTRSLDLSYTSLLSSQTMKVPRERLGYVNYTVSCALENYDFTAINTGGLTLKFSQAGQPDQVLDWTNSMPSTNFYSKSLSLKPNIDCQVSIQTKGQHIGSLFVRIWTPSTTYHYGSYAAIDDPMGGNPLAFVEELQGAALRMRVMNDCYTDYAGSIIITDCSGAVSTKYDSTQSIPTDYIFADEGSFPHYPFVPFFCDSTPANSINCVPGTYSKYDIQFVAGEFTVTRSFQCRPGVGSVNPNCTNLDDNGNYYCDRTAVPYMRGPTGQLPDCLGHGHLEFDFYDTESYVCVCDSGYSGVSCQLH